MTIPGLTLTDILAEPLEELLRATRARIGIVIATDNVELLKGRLYKARAKHAADHPELLDLTIRTSPEAPNEQVLIVKSNLKDILNERVTQDSPTGHSQLPDGREGDLQVPPDPTEGPDGGP